MHSCNDTDNVTCVLVEVTGSPDDLTKILRELQPIISNELRIKLEIVFQITLFTVSSLFGTVGNIINIIVYKKQGLRDSITMGLFILSISDFFVVFFPLFTAGAYLTAHIIPNSPINYIAVAGVSVTAARNMFYSLSCSLTALLSVERCFCVIRPFKVKLIFNLRRTTIVFMGLVVFYVVSYIPLFASHQLRWQEDPRMNFTEIYTLWYHPISEYIMAYNYSVMSIVLPTTAQIVVTCTAVIMINGLRKASRFRQSLSAHAHSNNASKVNSNGDQINVKDTTKGDSQVLRDEKNRNRTEQTVLGSRDARLVKTMVILVAVLSAANIPFIALKYSQIIVPEMNPRRRFANLFRLLSSINFYLASMNASVNALIYYHTGSRYREIVKELFSGRK